MNFSTTDFTLNDRKKLIFSHFDHFPFQQNDFTLDELYSFLDKKVKINSKTLHISILILKFRWVNNLIET